MKTPRNNDRRLQELRSGEGGSVSSIASALESVSNDQELQEVRSAIHVYLRSRVDRLLQRAEDRSNPALAEHFAGGAALYGKALQDFEEGKVAFIPYGIGQSDGVTVPLQSKDTTDKYIHAGHITDVQ